MRRASDMMDAARTYRPEGGRTWRIGVARAAGRVEFERGGRLVLSLSRAEWERLKATVDGQLVNGQLVNEAANEAAFRAHLHRQGASPEEIERIVKRKAQP